MSSLPYVDFESTGGLFEWGANYIMKNPKLVERGKKFIEKNPKLVERGKKFIEKNPKTVKKLWNMFRSKKQTRNEEEEEEFNLTDLDLYNRAKAYFENPSRNNRLRLTRRMNNLDYFEKKNIDPMLEKIIKRLIKDPMSVSKEEFMRL